MKRKDLYNYIKEEIVEALSETTYAGKGAKPTIQQDPKWSALKSDAKKNALADLDKGGDVELEEAGINEMARKAGTYKVGEADKFAEAKELYSAGLYADLLKAVEEAGEEGITQKELGIKLGKGDGSSLNLTLNKFKDIGVLGGGKLAAAEKPELEPEEEPVAGDEMDDEFYKDEEETKPEEKPEIAPEEKPEIEKVAGKTQATKLSPEDEDRYAKLKKGIDAKIARLKDMSAEKRGASDDMKSLKQLVNRKDIIDLFKAKGVDVKDLISDL